MKQLNFKINKPKLTFGGSNLKSSPKCERPMDTKSAMHLTLKCAKGVLRLPKTQRFVDAEVQRVCRKYGFTLYQYSNNSNHLHLLMRVTHRYLWRAFIRELTGRLAQIVKKLSGVLGTFWLGRPFSRIIKGWGRNYQIVKEYIELNVLEATRKLSREEARRRLKLRNEILRET